MQTFYALAASLTATFAFSVLSSAESKLNMVCLQFSILHCIKLFVAWNILYAMNIFKNFNLAPYQHCRSQVILVKLYVLCKYVFI